MGAVEGIPGPGGIVVSAGWGDAVIRVPLALWERYGDTTALEENLGAMRSWGTSSSQLCRCQQSSGTTIWVGLAPLPQ